MKSFFKYLLATVIGMLIVSLIMFFITLGSIGALFSGMSSQPPVQVKDNSVLEIRLNKPISDKSGSALDNFNFLNPTDLSENKGLPDYLKAIRAAKEDSRIKGIFLNYEGAGIGMATVQELRNALVDFKESGKFIYGYADSYTQSAYYLMSVADSLFLQPQGMVNFQGLSAKIMFFTKFFEKLGVEMQVIRHGQFKSAVEPYFRTDMSEANRKQYNVMFGSMWDVILKDISASRSISKERLNEIADNLEGFTASGSLKAGLVDMLVPSSYMKDVLLRDRMGVTDSNADVNTVSLENYCTTVKENMVAKDKIAVIYAEGEITIGKSRGNGKMGTEVADQIKKALKDKSVKAMVLRVNSPGGAVITADIIYQEIIKAKAKMPVVASYGDYAASGGYYISCPADRIFASPNTLTGSIGVFGTIPNVQGLVSGKLGLAFDEVGTNKNAGSFKDVYRPMTSFEEAKMQQSIEEIYDGFISKVAEGRKMTKAQVDSVGQGRVWSGTNALEIGLVDELGGLDDAVAYAAELAGLESYQVESFPKAKDFATQLMEMLGNSETVRAEAYIESLLGVKGLEIYRQINGVMSLDEPTVVARMPALLIFE